MAFTKIQPSFGAGELSPSLYARVDMEKYKVGAALLRNMFVDYRGGASTRPGTQFIGQCKDNNTNTRLIPFQAATDQAYIIEVGFQYMRFIFDGAYLMSSFVPYEIATPYQVSDISLLKYTQSVNVLTITHPSYPVYNLTRTGPSTFALTAQTSGATVQPPASLTGTVTVALHSDGVYSYVVTAVSSDGKEESVPCHRVDVVADLPGHTDNPIAPRIKLAWAAPSTPVSYYKVYKCGPTQARPTNSTVVNTVFGYIGQSVGTTFFDWTETPDFSHTPPQLSDPFSPGQISKITVASAGSGYSSGYTIDLIFSGGGGSGAAGYAVIDPNANTIVAVVLTNPGAGYTTAPACTDSNGTATYTVTLGQLSGTYPGCVTYFQQRRTFGGTNNFPESFVCSQPGQYSNFDTSAVSSASDSLTVSIASRQDNSIRSMVPMSTGLVIFTTGGGFLITGGNSQAAITPADVVALPQASSGANDLPPLVVNYDILYCQNRGAVVRDLAFNFYVQSYTGTDRSVLASHLFLNHTLKEWAYAEEPFRLINVVREDGVMLAFTYVPEQEVFAWSHYDTNGLFQSVTSVPEGQENAVYVIVKRFKQGGDPGDYGLYVERFASRLFTQLADAWFLDCALALPQVYPSGGLFLSAASGLGITALSGNAIFTGGDVGNVIWAGGGRATVTAFINASTVRVDISAPFPTVPNDSFNTPLPFPSGAWSYDVPVTSVSGLDHLNGLMVAALVDGVPLAPQLCVGGTIQLPVPATKVIAGLPYQCQLQTLKLDLGEPTVQGKRKNIPAVTLRVNQTLGLKAGPDASNLVEIKDLQVPYTPPMALISDDVRILIQSKWKKDGQVFFQQDYPLPATILGVIPEVVVGDTGR